MFGQVIDLLVKKDDERKDLIILLLKFLFTTVISVKIYLTSFGQFSIISFTDYKAIIEFFIYGKAIICFALFYFTWQVFFALIPFLIGILAFKLTSKVNSVINFLFDYNAKQLLSDISNDPEFKIKIQPLLSFLDTLNIIEISKNNIGPGIDFYNFFDFLVEIENNERKVPINYIYSKISLIIQFLLILFWIKLGLTLSWLTITIITIVTFIILIVFFLILLVLTVFDMKHKRLLDLMEQIDPDYLENENIEEVQEPVGSKANPLVIELKKKKVKKK